MSSEPARPLAGWRFDGTLRAYQADALRRIDVDAGTPLHVVAPPGSGKTLLGILLAARRGRRTAVFAPTVAIRQQWVDTARAVAHRDAAVSGDPDRPSDLTALTYQSVSVLDPNAPFAGLARARWLDELAGDERTPDAAARWLDELSVANPAAFRRGIRSRSRALRRSLAGQDAETLIAALHPNARDLIDRLVDAGVETVVLDECHHLLDHWALVVAALVARIRASGREPLVIGLTATLPSPDDAEQYDNYVSLLGDVDLEVPVPAVVREGDLAPYRDLVHLVSPTPEEQVFLSAHADALQVAVRTSFAIGSGRAVLHGILQPPLAAAADPLSPPPANGAPDDLDRRLAAAFAEDFSVAEAAAAMLSSVAPDDPLVARLPETARRPPTTDEALRLLGRHALDRVLPDPRRADEWRRVRRLLADFGYALTDRGVRRTRDPLDTVLASSLAKDRGACDILALERAALGPRLRALVVTDFVRHGNVHGGLLGAGGAVRTFSVVATDAATSGLRAILVTASTVRLPAHEAEEVRRAAARATGLDLGLAPVDDDPYVVEVTGLAGSGVVRLAADLLTRGVVQVVVGTRAQFGEGWDCPAVNTVIDLTAVATSTAAQQLRGRALRLDPAWPEKTAHTWTVTAIVPASLSLEAQPDAARLRRKHARLWGLDADDPASVVRGLSAALTFRQRRALEAVLAKEPGASLADADGLRSVPARDLTRAQWRIGDAYTDDEESCTVIERPEADPAFRSSAAAARTLGTAFATTLGAAGAAAATAFSVAGDIAAPLGGLLALGGVVVAFPLGRSWRRARRQVADAPATLRVVTEVVWNALSAAGRVEPVDGVPVLAAARSISDVSRIGIRMPSARPVDQAVLGEAMTQLCGPIRSPRFVLEIDRGGRSWPERAALGILARGGRSRFLAVPLAIGRRRGDAERFAGEWGRRVGPAILHDVAAPAAAHRLNEARRAGGFSGAARVMMRWG